MFRGFKVDEMHNTQEDMQSLIENVVPNQRLLKPTRVVSNAIRFCVVLDHGRVVLNVVSSPFLFYHIVHMT